MALTLELPPQEAQTAINLRRWADLLADSAAANREKTALYFDAGAQEVWLCSPEGAMTFFAVHSAEPLEASRICPQFPNRVQLR